MASTKGVWLGLIGNDWNVMSFDWLVVGLMNEQMCRLNHGPGPGSFLSFLWADAVI